MEQSEGFFFLSSTSQAPININPSSLLCLFPAAKGLFSRQRLTLAESCQGHLASIPPS